MWIQRLAVARVAKVVQVAEVLIQYLTWVMRGFPGILVKRCMYLKHQNCMYLCYCWRCGFIFSCQSWKTIPTGILCQTRYWTDKPKLTASTLNSEVWVSCFLFGGFTNIFNPPDEKLIYFTYVQCNVVVVVKRGGILLPICWALTASFTGHSRNPMQRASISVFGKSDHSRGWQKSWIRLVKSETNTVYSGNSKRLNSEQSLISEHFWWNWAIFL